jgi:CrcB protein
VKQRGRFLFFYGLFFEVGKSGKMPEDKAAAAAQGSRRAPRKENMSTFITYLWIGFGGALGSVLRYAVSLLVAGGFGETFPWGTLVVNVTGSFIIGFLAMVMGPDGRLLVNPDIRQFLLVGCCGGYTTFSSFSLQTQNLARQGDFLLAGGNILLSVILCLLAVWLGAVAAGAFNELKGA